MQLAQELCCDAAALGGSAAKRRCYAETLLQTLEFIQTERSLSTVLTVEFGPIYSIKRRFEMIADAKLNERRSWWIYAVILTVAVVLPCHPVRGNPPTDLAEERAAEPVLPVNNPLAAKAQEPPTADETIAQRVEAIGGRAGQSSGEKTADPYAVPGDVAELVTFIQQLTAIRPATVEEDIEHRANYRPALRKAAQRILDVEKDPQSEAYRAAEFILLSDRAYRIAQAVPREQRRIVADVGDYLKKDASQGEALAMMTAKTLRQMGEWEQAIEAYSQFAAVLANNDDAALAETKSFVEQALLQIQQMARQMPKRAALEIAPQGKLVPIDLQAMGNRKLRDNAPGSRFRGNTLAELPLGEQNLGGVTFWIGEMGLQLGSTMLPDAPTKLEVPVEQIASKLYVLHGTQWGYTASVKDGMRIGEYKIHYEDGSTASMPIVLGEDVRDWWTPDGGKPVTRGKVVWTGANMGTVQVDQSLRLYLGVWENPHPERKLARIEYISEGNTECAPFCIAITLEAPPESPSTDNAAAENSSDAKTTAQTQAAASSAGETVDQVLAGMAVNNDKLGAVELSLYEIQEDLSVTKVESETIKTPANTIVTVTRSPRKEKFARVFLDGPWCRYDSLDSNKVTIRSFIRTDTDIWREYRPKVRAITIRRPDQLAGIGAVDPRQLCSLKLGLPIEAMIRENSIESAERLDGEGGAILIEMMLRGDQKFSVEFSPQFSYLPVRSLLYHPDGSGIIRATEASYQKVESRDAWVLDEVVRRDYTNGGVPTHDSPGWTQVKTTRVVDVKLLDHDKAQVAINDLPREGFRIEDHTKGMPPLKQPPEPANTNRR